MKPVAWTVLFAAPIVAVGSVEHRPVVVAALTAGLAAGIMLAYLNGRTARRPGASDPALPLSHVRLAGETHRCANCKRRRPTMDLADGWGPRAAVLPYCGPCIREDEDAEGEVVA